MKKYWTIFKLELQKDMQYRFNFFARILSNAIYLTFFSFFWIKIYSEGNKIGSYDLKSILTYYFFATIFTFLLFRDLGWFISDEIREGTVKNFLLRPISYFLNHFAQHIGGLITNFIYYAPVVLIAFVLLKDYFVYPQNFIQLIFFVLSFFLAIVMYFLIYYIIGLTSFWLGMIQGLNHGLQVLVAFMGGKYLPLDLFPIWLRNFTKFLPFQYMLYEPISIFLNKILFNWQSLFIPLGWVVILGFVSHIVWKRGVRVYEAYGA